MMNRIVSISAFSLALATVTLLLGGCPGSNGNTGNAGDGDVVVGTTPPENVTAVVRGDQQFDTPEALLEYAKEVNERQPHDIRTWSDLIVSQTPDEEYWLYFFRHFEVARFRLAQAVTEHYNRPYLVDKHNIWPLQFSRWISKNDQEAIIETSDDDGRIRNLILVNVDGNWRISARSYVAIDKFQNALRHMKPYYGVINDLPEEMEQVIAKMAAGEYADAREARAAASALLPGGGQPSMPTITTEPPTPGE